MEIRHRQSPRAAGVTGLLLTGLLVTSHVILGAEAAHAAPAQADVLAQAAGHCHPSGQCSGHRPATSGTTTAAAVTVVNGTAERVYGPALADGQPHQPPQLPDVGFDGIAVAAIGTGLTGAGWLLMLIASRRLRRRSR